MATPRRRQGDKYLKSIWLKLSILVLVLGTFVTLMTNLFGNKIKPEVNSRLNEVEAYCNTHRVESAEVKANLKNLKELMLRIEKKVDRLIWRRDGGSSKGGSVK